MVIPFDPIMSVPSSTLVLSFIEFPSQLAFTIVPTLVDFLKSSEQQSFLQEFVAQYAQNASRYHV